MDDDSDGRSSSSATATSGAKDRPRARSAADRDQFPPSSSNHPNPSSVGQSPIMPAPGSSYPPLDPFSFMNTPQQFAGPHGVFSPGQPETSHGVLSRMGIPEGYPYPGFPGPQSLPSQFPPHLAMWPYMPQQFASFNNPHHGTSPGLENPEPSGVPQQFPYHVLRAGSSRLVSRPPGSPVASTSQTPSPTSTGQVQGQTYDPEESAVLEDKRRRNTAASARFRIKKKQKTLNLERTVSDLTSRADELEREATDLRRENNWLKEMVIMKGRDRLGKSQVSRGREPNHLSESEDGGTGEDSTSEDSDGRKKKKGKSESKATGKGKEREKEKGGKGKKGKKS